MFRDRLSVIFALFCLYAHCGNANPRLADIPYPTGGDAHGIGGGDPLDGILASVAQEVRDAIEMWEEGSAEHCPLSLSLDLCQRTIGLSKAQRRAIHAFGQSVSQAIGKLDLRVSLVGSPLQYCSRGACRQVRARTALSPKGEVQLHRAFAASASRDMLVALIAHELGHKVPLPQGHVKDETPVPGFASGREFLDAFGALVAWRASGRRLPGQQPPALPSGIETQRYCAAVAAHGPVKAGFAVDLLGKAEGASVRALQSKEWRQREIQRLFRELLGRQANGDELSLMEMLLSREANFATLSTALFTDREYANRHRLIEDRAYVERVLTDLLGRAPSGKELSQALADHRAMGREAFVLHWISENPTVRERRIARWFTRWLNRAPSASEQVRLNEGLAQGMSWEGAQRMVLESSEYAGLQIKRSSNCRKTARLETGK